MKNLENYGVVSLDSREMLEIDGGLWGMDGWDWMAIAATAAYIALMIVLFL